jgi:hypothetical protein
MKGDWSQAILEVIVVMSVEGKFTAARQISSTKRIEMYKY